MVHTAAPRKPVNTMIQIRREDKPPKPKREAAVDNVGKIVNTNVSDIVKKMPDSRLKWLQLALLQAAHSKVKPSAVYEVVADKAFKIGMDEEEIEQMTKWLGANSHLFSSKQQKVLQSKDFAKLPPIETGRRDGAVQGNGSASGGRRPRRRELSTESEEWSDASMTQADIDKMRRREQEADSETMRKKEQEGMDGASVHRQRADSRAGDRAEGRHKRRRCSRDEGQTAGSRRGRDEQGAGDDVDDASGTVQRGRRRRGEQASRAGGRRNDSLRRSAGRRGQRGVAQRDDSNSQDDARSLSKSGAIRGARQQGVSLRGDSLSRSCPRDRASRRDLVDHM